MQTPLMRAITPEPINTDVAYTGASLDHGNQNFISQEEKDAFINAPKTPVKVKKPLVCPGAPERKKLSF
jgi:hypothetical protein